MLINLWPVYWKNPLVRLNVKMDQDNGKAVGMVNGRYQIVWRFSSNEFWKNIGCLVSALTFGIGGSRLWEKEEAQNISGRERNMCSIVMKVDLYEVFLSYNIYCLLFYFMTILTPFFSPDSWYLYHQGKGVQEILAKRI